MGKFGFSADFIEEVKRRNDLVAVVGKAVSLQKKGKNFWACCPFHFEKTPSFAINEDEQFYHCYGCGENGDVIKFLQKYDNLTFVEAVKTLAQNAGMEIPEFEDNSKDVEQLKLKEKVLRALNLAKDYYMSQLTAKGGETALEYAKSRGLDGEIARDFMIGFSPSWQGLVEFLKSKGCDYQTMKEAGLVEFSDGNRPYDVFATRLMFPIVNTFGDVVGFTGRSLDPNSKFAKYRNSTQTIVFDKSRTIYNLFSVKTLKKSQNIEYIVLCEGTVDVIAMHKAGVKTACACMGTAITNYHAKELKKYTDKVILCLDGDAAGQHATYRAIDILTEVGLEVRVVKLKENLDPDEFLKKYGAEELKNSLNTALDFVEYKLNTIEADYNLQDNFQKTRYIASALAIISELNSSAEKEVYLKIVSNKTNVPIDILRRDLDNGKRVEDKTLEVKETALETRKQGYQKAVEFVIASIVHKQPYAIETAFENPLVFKNSNFQNMYNFAKKCYDEKKTYTISALYDYFDVENNEDLKNIINYNFETFSGNLDMYFNECLQKLQITDLRTEQDELMKEYKTSTDMNRRREIALRLTAIAKEMKKGER